MTAISDVKRLYGLIRDGVLPDDSDGVQDRVNIVRRLEELTHTQFNGTSDFHNKVSAFLARNDSPGAELRAARKERGWTLDTLGAYLGVSKQFCHKMEAGTKPLTDKALEMLCKQPIETPTEAQNG